MVGTLVVGPVITGVVIVGTVLVASRTKDPNKEPNVWFKDGMEPKWHFDANRKLVIETDKLTANEKKTIRGLVNVDEVEIV